MHESLIYFCFVMLDVLQTLFESVIMRFFHYFIFAELA